MSTRTLNTDFIADVIVATSVIAGCIWWTPWVGVVWLNGILGARWGAWMALRQRGVDVRFWSRKKLWR